MKRPFRILICICTALLLTSCSTNTPGKTQPVQSMEISSSTPTIPVTSATPDINATPMPAQTISSSTDKRAWRHFVYIPIETQPETSIQQGDCKTTYTPVQTTGIKDAGFKTWLDGEITSFFDGILKDENGIQKTKQLFRDKGLDKEYPGATFIRRVSAQVYSSGGVLSLQATDYCVYRPTDADIEKDQLGWRDGDGTLRYTYEWGPTTSDEGGKTKYAEAYTYQISTKCLNMLERKPMQLIDLLRGEEGLQKLNLAISQQISDMKLDDSEVLKRPFAGLTPDYNCFSIQNYGPGSGYISVGFNEGNPWFNLQSPNWWSTYRQIGIDLAGMGAILNPIWYDDSLLPMLEERSAGESMYGVEQGKKYMPDLGLAEYTVTDGQKRVRVTHLSNVPASERVLEKINTGIEEFESKYLNDATIMGTLFFSEAQVKPGDPGYKESTANKPAYSAYIQEMGNILQINYRITLNMREASLCALYDLNTGKRLAAADLLTKQRPNSKEYNDVKGKLTDTLLSLNRYGSVCLFYQNDVKAEEERQWTSRLAELELPEQYFDWEKWGVIS